MILLKLNRSRDAIVELKVAIGSEVRAPFLYQALGIAYTVSGNLKKGYSGFQNRIVFGARLGRGDPESRFGLPWV